jgi:hypothetical protein
MDAGPACGASCTQGEEIMLQKIAFYGTVGGLVVGGILFGVTVINQGHPPPSYGVALGYASMLLALSAVFFAIKRHRDVDLGGAIKFWPAFGLGLGISLVAGVFYVAAWEAALAVTGIDFAGDYSRALIEKKQAAGASAAEVADYAESLKSWTESYKNPLFRLPMTFVEIFPVGILVSLVSAGLLRNPRFLPAR